MADPLIIDHEIRMLDGDTFSLGVYRGLGLLICTLGSRGRHADQLAELDQINGVYGQMGLMVLGVPTNDFGGEPGGDESVRARYELDLRVSFSVTQRMRTAGRRPHKLFEDLTAPSGLPVLSDFEKFVIDGDGYLSERFGADVRPTDDRMKAALKFVLPTISY
ncbi:MAG: hypothetical protein R3F61_21870 [Myxococcota bacterium]